MEKVESALDVLSRAATMVQPCPAYPATDSEGFGKFITRTLLFHSNRSCVHITWRNDASIDEMNLVYLRDVRYIIRLIFFFTINFKNYVFNFRKIDHSCEIRN